MQASWGAHAHVHAQRALVGGPGCSAQRDVLRATLRTFCAPSSSIFSS